MDGREPAGVDCARSRGPEHLLCIQRPEIAHHERAPGILLPRGARSRIFINPAFARERRFPRKPVFRPTSVRNGQLGVLTQGFFFRRVEALAASGPRHGLEYRHPLLDRRVLELALSLPPEQFTRGPTTRYLMRHALDLKAVLPPAVCWHESKLGPACVDALFTARLEALPSIRQRLAVRAAPAARRCAAAGRPGSPRMRRTRA